MTNVTDVSSILIIAHTYQPSHHPHIPEHKAEDTIACKFIHTNRCLLGLLQVRPVEQESVLPTVPALDEGKCESY